MSLILDALRKADAERERGAVPGLHAQPEPVADAESPAPTRAPAWLWAGLGLTAGLVLAVAWFVFGRSAPAPEPATAAVPPAAPAALPSTLPLPPPAPAAPALASGSTPPAPQPMPALMAEPAPWPAADGRRAGERAPNTATEANTGPSPGAGSTPRVLTAESVPVAPEQLPEHIRAQLPQLTFGGSIYSSNAASRSLIVNGRLHRESEQVMPGLTLEQIKPKGAVFSFKGYRFEVLL